MMLSGNRGLRFATMADIMLMNIQIVLRRMLDALVGSWMRQTAAAAEWARTRTARRR
jgi:hypothetical protein